MPDGVLTMVACWECEAVTPRPMEVSLAVLRGRPRRVQLCPSCYRLYYLPLVAETPADDADRDPPLPTRGTPAARRTHR